MMHSVHKYDDKQKRRLAIRLSENHKSCFYNKFLISEESFLWENWHWKFIVFLNQNK